MLMKPVCEASKTIQAIRRGACAPIAFIGASLSVATGASDSSMLSWGRLFVRYLFETIAFGRNFNISELNVAIGGWTSPDSVFVTQRDVIAHKPVMVFIEECVNDRWCPDTDLVKKGIEGIIRKLRASESSPDIVILLAGARPGDGRGPDGLVDHRIHRKIAGHYAVPCLDIQDYLYKTLAARGHTWDHVCQDPIHDVHLNDYGNRMWFECMREWIDRQVVLYDQGAQPAPRKLPPVLWSDELQYTELFDPTRCGDRLRVQRGWAPGGDEVPLPWYMDNVIVGRPGDGLTFTFSGTSIALVCHVHNNALRLLAKLDGKDVSAPYPMFNVEFGIFYTIAHGLENTTHELELTVAQPMKRQNVLKDPQTRIGLFAVGGNRTPAPSEHAGD
jgi:hypothetical protein